MFIRFLIMTLVILAPGYGYLAWSLGDGSVALYGVLALPFVAILTMPLLFAFADRAGESWWRDGLTHAAHFGMGVATYLFVFALLRDGLRWASLFDAPAWGVGVATALALAFGAARAWWGPKLREVRVPVADLDPKLEGYRIVQITDLHIGANIRHAYVKRVVGMTNALKPDLVALTGDIADGDLNRLRPWAQPLADLQPKGRVFYVPGNHEYYWNVKDWLYEFKRLGCHLLLNEGARAGDVWVGGITDPAAASFGQPGPAPEKAIAGGEGASYRVLLSHRPGFARQAAEVGFDLQLSGHTHGGQFFPWTIVIAFVHEFHLGLKRAGQLWVYVGPGTGTWGPLLRLGTTPELTLLTLTKR